ncbi:MAG: pyrimidine/purine nucleosidase domain-containing protein, partial [Nitrospinota bacterium]
MVKKNSDTYEMVARVTPERSLSLLSQLEVSKLRSTSVGGLYELFRRCSLAILNSGNSIESGKLLFERYKDFDIHVIQQARGIKLEVINAPASAFVENRMIKGIKEHLFSVLRDVIYTNNEIYSTNAFDLSQPKDITNAVFHILRNANILKPQPNPNIVVCWGGHSISREEYHYTKSVGHILGLY